jgi:hypothetical protein
MMALSLSFCVIRSAAVLHFTSDPVEILDLHHQYFRIFALPPEKPAARVCDCFAQILFLIAEQISYLPSVVSELLRDCYGDRFAFDVHGTRATKTSRTPKGNRPVTNERFSGWNGPVFERQLRRGEETGCR